MMSSSQTAGIIQPSDKTVKFMVLEPKVLQLDLSSKDPKRKSLSRNEFCLNIYKSEECHIVGVTAIGSHCFEFSMQDVGTSIKYFTCIVTHMYTSTRYCAS